MKLLSDVLGRMAIIALAIPVVFLILGTLGWSGLILAAFLVWVAIKLFRLAKQKLKENKSA